MKFVFRVFGWILFIILFAALAFDWLGFHQIFGRQIDFDLSTARVRETRFLFFRPIEIKIEGNPVSKIAYELQMPGEERWRIAIRRPFTSKKAEGLSAAKYLITNKTMGRLIESGALNDDEAKSLVRDYLTLLAKDNPDAADEFSE